jgi:hypothetical protein
MRRLRSALTSLLFVLCCFSISSFADCSAPSSPGVRICTPTQNSTSSGAFGAYMEFNSTPKSGAIHRFIVYIDDKIHYVGDPYQTGLNLGDGSVYNGTHLLVVKAWDTGGNVLEARRTFNVINAGFGPCPKPGAPGLNVCDPIWGSYQPNMGFPISVAARGYSGITNVSFFVDGKLSLSSGDNPVGTSAETTAGRHTIKIVAKDSTGHTFSVSRLIHAYYEFSCPPKEGACSPGVVIQAPYDEEYVQDPFLIDASVENNPNPITSMKAYVGNTLVASSSGPTLYQHVSAANGTHVLRVDAIDTKGRLYRSIMNVSVNVPH